MRAIRPWLIRFAGVTGLSLFTFKYVEKRANDAGYRLSRKYFGPQPHQADLLTAP